MGGRIRDLTGQRFGRLVAVRSCEERRNGSVMWECRCDCGTTLLVRAGYLTFGSTVSCGCYRKDQQRAAVTTHGGTLRREYRIWAGIRTRCVNEKDKRYHDYGGRGIVICNRWKDSFENFYADMGPRPSPKHSIDRRNNDGPYSPENCRWATEKEQQMNRSTTFYVSYSGKTQNLNVWSQETGIPHKVIYTRMYRGWSAEKALTTPYTPRKKK